MVHRSLCFALLLGVGIGFADQKTIRFPLISDARVASPSTWHYTTDDPGATWADTDFVDDAWQSGTGGFGSGTPENAHINTDWSTGQIWLRASFTLPDVSVNSLVLSLYHDEDVQIFLNGKPVFQEASFIIDYEEPTLSDDFKAALKPGRNVLAIMCTNTDGPGYIDAGLAVLADFEAVTLVGDASTAAPADWSYTTADPGADWANSDFDASAWTTGKALFGTTTDFTVGTPWSDPDIWLRTTFQVTAKSSQYDLSFLHDDGMEAFVNGTQVLQATQWNGAYDNALSAAVASAVLVGKNTLAVHCHNDQGPQFIDVGLYGVEKPLPTGLAGKARILAASGRGPSLVAGSGSRLDLTALGGNGAGRLTVFGTDGRALAEIRTSGATRSLALPATLGTGVFRYRWEAFQGKPSGSQIARGTSRTGAQGSSITGAQGTLHGTLLKLP